MKIKIAERLRPFSHSPGTKCVLPGSSLCVEVFPVLIRVEDLEGKLPLQEISLPLTGPAKGFTVQLDLEKGCVWVWGTYSEGYKRYRLFAEQGQFKMAEKRENTAVIIPPVERLSLGSHKKQDFDLVKRRGDLIEIFPHWLRLGQWVPFVESTTFQECLNAIEKREKEKIHSLFLNQFKAGFEGILSPRTIDSDYQGFGKLDVAGSPLALLSQGALLIRSLFIKQEDKLSILPCLPPEFHAGRFTGISLGELGSLDLEWSKKMIRRMILRSRKGQILPLEFQKDVQTFRLRKGSRDKGHELSVKETLVLEADGEYFFDRFQK